MGWDGIRLPAQGKADVLGYVLNYIHHEVRQAYVTDDAVYLAVKQADDAVYRPGNVLGLVVAYQHRNDGMTFFKYMAEDEGPYYIDAPPSLIRKLSPPANQNAKRWRQECLANHTLSDGESSVVVEFVN